MGNWDNATHTDLASLQWILNEIALFLQAWGRLPTATELRQLLYGHH